MADDSASPLPDSQRVVVQVTLDVRLASVLMLLLLEGREAGPAGVLVTCLAVALSYMALRGGRLWSVRLDRGWSVPVLDATFAMGVLLVYGAGGWALGYVVATLFLWALVGRRHVTAWVAAPFLATFVVLLLLQITSGQAIEAVLTAGRLVVLTAAIPAGSRVRETLREQAALLRRLAEERARSGRAEERARLSVDMHDSVAKSLHGIHLLAGHLESRLAREEHPGAAAARALRVSVHQARTEARALVSDLREQKVEDLTTALRQQLDAWEEAHPEIRVERSLPQVRVTGSAGHEWLHAIGEALENVARHARASWVRVRLEQRDGWTTAEVVDDGVGMPPDPRPDDLVEEGHFGLDGVHRRMARLHGRCTIGPGPDGGTRVALTAPAPTAEPSARADTEPSTRPDPEPQEVR